MANKEIDLLLLAAGFATRLEPLTLNQPKHLLETKSGRFVDPLIDQLQKSSLRFSKKVLITNDRYFDRFVSWQKESSFKLDIYKDGVSSKENRIGAVGDLLFAIDRAKIKNNLLVLAMDYIYKDFKFDDFISFARGKNSSAIVIRQESDISQIKAGSCVLVDKDSKVTRFEEKPPEPFSDLYGVPYYFIKKEDLPLLKKIDKKLRDNSGQIASKIYQASNLYAFRSDGEYFHMTTKEDYERIKGYCQVKSYYFPRPLKKSTK
ncbi:MAG: sugar phosphate nucleotidyltransferase [bacterium]